MGLLNTVDGPAAGAPMPLEVMVKSKLPSWAPEPPTEVLSRHVFASRRSLHFDEDW